MLEAIRDRSKGWLAKVILAAITVPFALVGVDSYLRDAGSNVAVATVNGDSITVQEYGNALQNLRNRLQSQGKVDPSVIDGPEIKQAVVDQLIADRLLAAEIKRANFVVSDEQLAHTITSEPEFQQDGKFSQQLYDQFLAERRRTPSQFEGDIRNDLLSLQAREGLSVLAFVPTAVVNHAIEVEHQSREVSVSEIKTADFIAQASVTPEEVKAYYTEHQDKFKVPAQVKLDFVLLSANALISGQQVSDDEAKDYYAQNAAQFQGDEQRRASHILIGFGVSPTPEAKQQAKAKAAEVLALVKKNPEQFEALAKQYSQDPSSKDKGGDLGLFGPGAMVKPFEDAVFSMKPGTITDLVESDFGYHIIKLTEIKGSGQSFDEVKGQIRAELLYQKALAKFSEQAENFSNMVYEQADSLEPAAKAFGMQVQTSGWLSRADGAKFFKNDKLMDMVFSDEVLKDKRNTEAIEVSPNNLLSARVAEYKPAAARTFDEVKAAIEDFLKQEKGTKLAREKGEAALASLREGKAITLDWTPPVTVDRKNPQSLTDLSVSTAFKANASKLPAYAGVSDKNGYLVVKVSAVNAVADSDEAKASAKADLQAAMTAEYRSAYIKSLKQKSKIKINNQLLDADQANP
ncbi:SurA N-terminal domain-containing protein [Methylobacillus gramineus]|uniref:SurA N-terminal domain-containing protein n=1 Tax=Methylobacillus gramineus TaxID=755169 RepID=UPI001CFF8A35|nr:SurA N-terminal domain-containing protein [Methylobacillus gramineus]MCB5184447.1 SurA N-terminal domain-containing protein [Methylobacillus gramineus]